MERLPSSATVRVARAATSGVSPAVRSRRATATLLPWPVRFDRRARVDSDLRVDTASVIRHDGTIDMSQRARLSIAVDAARLEHVYWDEVMRATFGLVRFSGSAICVIGGWPALLRFGPLADGRREILGGWFARRPGGTIAWRCDGEYLSVEVEGFAPFVRGPLFRLESLYHERVGRRFLARVELEVR